MQYPAKMKSEEKQRRKRKIAALFGAFYLHIYGAKIIQKRRRGRGKTKHNIKVFAP